MDACIHIYLVGWVHTLLCLGYVHASLRTHTYKEFLSFHFCSVLSVEHYTEQGSKFQTLMACEISEDLVLLHESLTPMNSFPFLSDFQPHLVKIGKNLEAYAFARV